MFLSFQNNCTHIFFFLSRTFLNNLHKFKLLFSACCALTSESNFELFYFMRAGQFRDLDLTEQVAIDIFYFSTIPADKVMVLRYVWIKANCALFKDLSHQSLCFQPVER